MKEKLEKIMEALTQWGPISGKRWVSETRVRFIFHNIINGQFAVQLDCSGSEIVVSAVSNRLGCELRIEPRSWPSDSDHAAIASCLTDDIAALPEANRSTFTEVARAIMGQYWS